MLHPDEPVRPGTLWTPSEEIPALVRQFGKYPNTQDWLPGDVLLTSAVHPGWIQRKIVNLQSKTYGLEHGKWQHAAIYMGNDYVSEATLHGVVYSPVSKYVGRNLLHVRRHPTLTADQRWLTAIEAGVRIRQNYNLSDIWKIYIRRFPGFGRRLKPAMLRQTRAVICSELCVQSYGLIGEIIVPTKISPVLPASISQSATLRDIPLYWRLIA